MAKYVSRTRPYDHQAYALAKVIARKGGALLMEPGTGKTKVAVDFCGRKYIERGLTRVLIIAPLSVLTIWEREIEKHLGTRIPRKVIRLRGGIKKKTEQVMDIEDEMQGVPPKLQFIIVNYESLWREALRKELLRFNPECVIADESHKIKNPTSQQSRGVCKFNGAKFKLILTGTPITKSPLDIFGQWKFLRPEVFGENWFAFRNRYAVFGGYKNYEIVRFKNMDDLRHKVKHDAYLATKEECLTLPGKVYQDVEVELEMQPQKLYDTMEKDFCFALRSGEHVSAPIILTKLLRLAQITGGFTVDESGNYHQVGSEKLVAIKDLLSLYTYPEKKVVVFSRFLWEIDGTAKMCREASLGHVTFTGRASTDERDESIRKFNEDPTCKVFIAQIATGGLGIDLTAAQTVIFYSVDFDFGHYIQACDRVHRMGQKNKVLYLHLVVKNTIDDVILKALQTKENLADMVVKYVRERVK